MTRLADCLAEHAGASRLLWIDHLDYIARLLGGGRYPWLEVAPCVALLRMIDTRSPQARSLFLPRGKQGSGLPSGSSTK